MHAIVVATTDEALIHDAQRWCAAVAAEPRIARTPADARRQWRGAAAVIVGADLAPALTDGPLPRRDGVLMVAEESAAALRSAVSLGARAVLRPGDDAAAMEVLATVVDGRGEACVLSVVGAVGGAGATTIAALLARLASEHGHQTLLLDADPLGGGIDLVLGAEKAPGLRWSGIGGGGRLPSDGLVAALPAQDRLSFLTWCREDPPGAALPPVGAVLAAAARGFDVIVADVPRHLSPVGAEVVAASVLTVLVVPEDVRGIAAAGRVCAAAPGTSAGFALLTVAGSLGPDPVGDALGLPVLARWRSDRRIGVAVDRGHGPQPTRQAVCAATAILDAVGLA